MAPHRLLLVEDSSTMRRMLSTMLMEERIDDEKCFEVNTGNDGVQGLAKAHPTASGPDLDGLRDARARRRGAVSSGQSR